MDKSKARPLYVKDAFTTGFTWDDVEWLKSVTNLPIILKGILTGRKSSYAKITMNGQMGFHLFFICFKFDQSIVMLYLIKLFH